MVKVSGEKTDIMRCPASKQKRVSFKSSEPSKNGQDKTEIHVLLLLCLLWYTAKASVCPKITCMDMLLCGLTITPVVVRVQLE